MQLSLITILTCAAAVVKAQDITFDPDQFLSGLSDLESILVTEAASAASAGTIDLESLAEDLREFSSLVDDKENDHARDDFSDAYEELKSLSAPSEVVDFYSKAAANPSYAYSPSAFPSSLYIEFIATKIGNELAQITSYTDISGFDSSALSEAESILSSVGDDISSVEEEVTSFSATESTKSRSTVPTTSSSTISSESETESATSSSSTTSESTTTSEDGAGLISSPSILGLSIPTVLVIAASLLAIEL